MEKRPVKIVTIGGGSSYTPELMEGFIKRYDELPIREMWLVDIEEGREKDDGMSIFLNTLLVGLKSPFSALKKCFQVEPIDYFSSYVSAIGFSFAFFGIFVFVGVMKAMPSHEYEDIENGSSDWCEGGEQYKVLHKKKGIVLAENNYLPVDKRGNVNVLVVRRVWCW